MVQLKMEKTDLDDLPDIPVPEGYVLRTYEEGDEAAIGRAYAAADLGCTSAEEVRERIVGNPCFTPGRLFVVEHTATRELAGTAAAWVQPNDPGVGYLHMLGLLPEHRGKRLGALLTVATLHYTRNEGLPAQLLDTDDWRTPALRLYLDLGYHPLYIDDTHPTRWEAIAAIINRPEILDHAGRRP